MAEREVVADDAEWFTLCCEDEHSGVRVSMDRAQVRQVLGLMQRWLEQHERSEPADSPQ